MQITAAQVEENYNIIRQLSRLDAAITLQGVPDIRLIPLDDGRIRIETTAQAELDFNQMEDLIAALQILQRGNGR